jgi:hypothetical protein
VPRRVLVVLVVCPSCSVVLVVLVALVVRSWYSSCVFLVVCSPCELHIQARVSSSVSTARSVVLAVLVPEAVLVMCLLCSGSPWYCQFRCARFQAIVFMLAPVSALCSSVLAVLNLCHSPSVPRCAHMRAVRTRARRANSRLKSCARVRRGRCKQ